jgi:NitT/TauT family transport system substrate-binding protein
MPVLVRLILLFLALAALPARAADSVRVAMPTEGFLYTPLYLAIDAGFMKEEGIDAELIQFRGGGAAIAGLASGSVEFCACAIQNAINAAVKGSGVRLIGTVIGQYASNVVLREEVAKRLKITKDTPVPQRLAALKGLKIAGSGAGSSTDFLIRYLAKRAGLSPERDFTVLFLAGGGPILAAFSQARIDGFVLSSPTSDIAIQRYKGVLLLDMSRGELEELRGYPSIALSAKQSFLKAKGDVARRFLRALGKASRMIHADAARARQILRKRFAGVADEVYEAAWAANIDAYPQTPAIEEANVTRAIAFLGEVQGARIPGAAKDYFDASFADRAVRELNP